MASFSSDAAPASHMVLSSDDNLAAFQLVEEPLYARGIELGGGGLERERERERESEWWETERTRVLGA